jgi:hypothetical protein
MGPFYSRIPIYPSSSFKSSKQQEKREDGRERRNNPAIQYPSILFYEAALFVGPNFNPS